MKVGDHIEFVSWNGRRDTGIVKQLRGDDSATVSVDDKHYNKIVKQKDVVGMAKFIEYAGGECERRSSASRR